MRLTKTNIKNAIKGSYGNITTIAERLECSRLTVYRKLEKDPSLQSLLNDEREKILDLAENKLVANIENGSETSINFVLRTLGKKRGYGEKVEHSGTISINNIDLSKLTDEQLSILESIIKKGEDPKPYLLSVGINVKSN